MAEVERRLSGPAAVSGNTLTLTGAGTLVPQRELDRVHQAGSGGRGGAQ
jgi:hypothetical protein